VAYFNPFRPSYLRDPYPALARLREEEPIHYSKQMEAWVVTRYADCVEILRDVEHYSSNPRSAAGRMAAMVEEARGRSPLGDTPLIVHSDPPVHTRLRAIVNRAFTPRMVEARRDTVRRYAREILAGLPDGEPFDLMSTLAYPLPLQVTGDLLGLPEADRQSVHDWARAVILGTSGERIPPQAIQAAQAGAEALRGYLDRFRQQHHGDTDRSLIYILTEAEAEGDVLSADELLAFVRFLYTAGSTPVGSTLANGTLLLLDHAEQLTRLRQEPELMSDAVSEIFRFDGPTHVHFRWVAEPVQLGRRRLRQGDSVLAMGSAAARDPEEFDDPEVFDIGRGRSRHLNFGLGPHFCLGAPLAEMELEIMFEELLARFSQLELGPAGAVREENFQMRGMRRLELIGRP
jgi:cytochrome P450